MQEWNLNFLSRAGKEAFIKACVQACLVYTLNCFRFPKAVCDCLTASTLGSGVLEVLSKEESLVKDRDNATE